MKSGDIVWLKAIVQESPTGDFDAIVIGKDGRYLYHATVDLEITDYKEDDNADN